jgi:hypothetical protein
VDTPATVPGFVPGPDAIAQAESLQAQALKVVHHSERMKLVEQALAIRQGRAQPTATATQAPTAAPVATPATATATTPAPVASDPMAQMAEQFGLTPADLAAAQSNLDGKFGEASGVTAIGLASVEAAGVKAMQTLKAAIADLSDDQADQYLTRARESVSRLYRSPEAQRAAERDVADAAHILGLPREYVEEIGLVYSHDARAHQRIQLLAGQVLAAARRGAR